MSRIGFGGYCMISILRSYEDAAMGSKVTGYALWVYKLSHSLDLSPTGPHIQADRAKRVSFVNSSANPTKCFEKQSPQPTTPNTPKPNLILYCLYQTQYNLRRSPKAVSNEPLGFAGRRAGSGSGELRHSRYSSKGSP